MFGYGLGRVWIEGLRTDQLIIPGTGIAVSQLLAGALVIGMGILLVYFRKKYQKQKNECPAGEVDPDADPVEKVIDSVEKR
mgnify:FL=1